MRISDWSSDVCSSDLTEPPEEAAAPLEAVDTPALDTVEVRPAPSKRLMLPSMKAPASIARLSWMLSPITRAVLAITTDLDFTRSEAHTSELQSLMRISYADFCLKKNTDSKNISDNADD